MSRKQTSAGGMLLCIGNALLEHHGKHGSMRSRIFADRSEVTAKAKCTSLLRTVDISTGLRTSKRLRVGGAAEWARRFNALNLVELAPLSSMVTDTRGTEMSRHKTSNPAAVRAACVFGLKEGMSHAHPDVAIDEKGYVLRAQDNLLEGLTLDAIEADLSAGAGQELTGKFRAVHSSSALAINCFAPLKVAAVPFSLGAHTRLHVEGFERRFPTGLSRAQPPHLDIMASGPDKLIAIESKCLEYLSAKRPKFSDRYETEITDERAAGPWFAEMMRLRAENGATYMWLDAAPLIKHALGLARAHSAQPATLIYLYWEPMDAAISPLFEQHRAETAAFASRVAGGSPAFEAMSYPDLWNAWDATGDAFLVRHVGALRARYEVPAWAWEGVEWRDERLRSASWMDDLDDSPRAPKPLLQS